MFNPKLNYIRLPLDEAYNTRDLGGYPTADGKVTKYRAFLRSGQISYLSEGDECFLHDYGVNTVIDLRNYHEEQAEPDKYVGRDDVSYHHIPLFSGNIADINWVEELDEELSVLGMYRSTVSNTETMGKILSIIASAEPGCILFHCTAGKDRTGILAMILLKLASVSNPDIVANYVQSRHNLMLSENFAHWWEVSEGRSHAFLDSAPESIECAMSVVDDEFGGVENYLSACGLLADEVAQIRNRLV